MLRGLDDSAPSLSPGGPPADGDVVRPGEGSLRGLLRALQRGASAPCPRGGQASVSDVSVASKSLCHRQCGGYAEMGLRDGPAPCKCMHGQPGVQGPPGPKVAAKTLESLHEQHTVNLLSLPVSGSQRASWRTRRPRKTRKLGKYSC